MILLVLLLQAAAPQPAPACTATDAALPSDYAGWKTAGADLAPGHALVLATQPAATPAPDKPGRVAEVAFAVAKPGRYRIALDQRGWIDVRAKNAGQPLTSVDHGHGPACSTVAKFVTFQLDAGSYLLSLSGLAQPQARVMLIPAGS